jgi:hypothetical protein
MLRGLPDLSVDTTSAAWSIVRIGIVLATVVLSQGHANDIPVFEFPEQRHWLAAGRAVAGKTSPL